MYLRAAVAAALAVLVSGDPVKLGWAAIGAWHFVFPYFWLFVLLESARGRRRVEDGEVFLAGAAMAALYGGVYSKDFQHGFHPFGIDWFGSLSGIFDGGLTTLLSYHFAVRLRPRREGESAETGIFTIVFLAFGLGGAALVYGVKTAFNFYRADRMLGSTWLVADLLFAGLAWMIARRAWDRTEEAAETEREPWVWGLAAFSVWLPGARFVAQLCAAVELPGVLMYFFVGAWTAVCWGLCWRLWRERGHAELDPVPASRPAKLAMLWRAAGALLLVAALGSGLNDARTAGIFSAAIDWPSRALFAWAFLTARLAV